MGNASSCMEAAIGEKIVELESLLESLKTEETIKVDELIESIENGDLTLVEKFTKWYFDVGKNDCIEEYKTDLQNMVNNYALSNKIKMDVALGSLSYEQIQELIYKLDNADKELDKELCGIE